MLTITSGDPFSIAVEVLSPLLASLPKLSVPVVIVGSQWQWHDQCQRLGLKPPAWKVIQRFQDARPGHLSFFDFADERWQVPAETMDLKTRGELSVLGLSTLKTWTPPPRWAVVTSPIDKFACHQAGYGFPGQTEFFENLWGEPAVMTLAGPKLRVGLVTNHLPLAAVADALTVSLVHRKLRLFHRTLTQQFAIERPRIAVTGLNPHASDHGLFGNQEAQVIRPAIESFLKEESLAQVTGPVAADTVFYRALKGDFDGVLAIYHDQGLGPLKTVHFDNAVNVSGGLPHFRCSPDHGPASDIFLKGKASAASFRESLRLALQYLGHKESGDLEGVQGGLR